MQAMLIRGNLQPRLVHLISGLRQRQVEEAVQLLLDYIDFQVATESQPNPSNQILADIRRHLSDYHFALDQRRCGVTVCSDLIGKLEVALGLPWVPGKELQLREGGRS